MQIKCKYSRYKTIILDDLIETDLVFNLYNSLKKKDPILQTNPFTIIYKGCILDKTTNTLLEAGFIKDNQDNILSVILL